jgi:CubicO group peptidase (beta-lactamase class C family)
MRGVGRAGVLCALSLAILVGPACRSTATEIPPARSIQEFEQQMEAVFTVARLPAMSVAIARNGEIVWAKGFGMADVAAGVAATPATRYHAASLTKGFATAVALQLVDEGKLSLDARVVDPRLGTPAEPILVRHVMSMTSHGTPGESFRYDGNRFEVMDSVIARAAGKSFAQLLRERIVVPLGLSNTSPSGDVTLSQMARGYAFEGGRNVPVAYPTHFSPSAGIVSTVLDIATFWHALSSGAVVTTASFARMIAPAVSTRGDTLPYALGTFSQRYGGERVVWAYGYWTGSSSLVMHVPATGVTFVAMSNSDQLSAPYGLGAGRLMESPLAREFVSAFVMPGAPLR